MGGKFYVYEHWRPDRDECFYVGKGFGRRANVMYARNRHHTAIQAKLSRLSMCVEVRLVAEALSEEEAFKLECERIAFWRSAGMDLANLTRGGEGTSDPSAETRELMRQAKLGRTLSEEHKRKIGESSRIAHMSEEYQKKRIASLKATLATPEVKAKRSASQKSRVRTKEHYEKVSAALTGRKLSPEHAAKVRTASKGRKQTPEEIERRRASNVGKKRDPEFCARMKAAWTPERKAAQAEINKARAKARKLTSETQVFAVSNKEGAK
jgi:hypothetical protein